MFFPVQSAGIDIGRPVRVVGGDQKQISGYSFVLKHQHTVAYPQVHPGLHRNHVVSDDEAFAVIVFSNGSKSPLIGSPTYMSLL